MAKINIAKPTGNIEALELLTAFKADGMTYIIFNSDKIGSMGLPIIYISKYENGKLEKVSDSNEWQNVKNYLKGIINGTNFEYVKVDASLNADEAYYMPLTLPQASFDLISSRYVVKEDTSSGTAANIPETLNAEEETLDSLINTAPIPQVNLGNAPVNNMPSANPTPAPEMASPVEIQPASVTENVVPTQVQAPQPVEVSQVQNVAPVTPVMPDNNVASNASINVSAPVTPDPVVQTPESSTIDAMSISNNNDIKLIENNFDKDKEMFLKACENMFDALISKYQKELADLERREQELARKEKEIEEKLHNASEHLANAAAREQVANIAHDNAQKVMDLSNLMPQNPESN